LEEQANLSSLGMFHFAFGWTDYHYGGLLWKFQNTPRRTYLLPPVSWKMQKI